MPKKPPPRKDQNRVPRAPRTLAPAAPREAERVAKVIARAGLGSRREIEEWIVAGRVAVNGEVLESPARNVGAEDVITVDGTPIPAKERTRLYLYHKPKGVVTTSYDPEGRPTLFEILPEGLPRLVSVGRLDLSTEGLILLTNDGGLARVLELPETGWLRRYRVRAKGEATQDALNALIDGITVDGIHYGPIEAALDRVQGSNVWLTLALREGKNREVRNVLGALGLQVNRLIRLSYGPFQLGEIPQGEVEEVRTRVLADQLGKDLAAAAGADFEAPVFHYGEEEEERPPTRSRTTRSEDGEVRHRRKPIATEPAEGRTLKAGILADRKGRKFLVQRVRSDEPEEAPARAPRGGRDFEERAPRRGRGADERGEAPRTSGERSFRPRGDRPEGGERPFRERGPRREGAEGERPFRDRSERPAGDRPFRERGPRREGAEGERPFRHRSERPAGDRPFRERGPRREGADGERPFRPRGDRPEGGDRPFRERAPRREGAEGERPFRARSERPAGDRPFRERPPRREGEEGARPFRPRGDRPEGGDRPFRDRPPRHDGEEGGRPFRPRAPRREGEDTGRAFRERAPRREGAEGERPFRDRPPRREGGSSERPYSGRVKSEQRGQGGRPSGGKPAGGKSFGEKSLGEKSFGGKPFAGKPGGRPGGGKPGSKPFGGKPSGGKPGGRPGGKPGGGGRPRGPRS